jgi:hypothetical protein
MGFPGAAAAVVVLRLLALRYRIGLRAVEHPR